tara:strand:+ start:848 stop:1057 length:210 start_codon:yes stop_codon:yes gene_type:complete
MKYRVDDWVIYRPFANSESELLREMSSRALILDLLEDDYFYDYKIYVEDTKKIKKVREHKLFPLPPPTY